MHVVRSSLYRCARHLTFGAAEGEGVTSTVGSDLQGSKTGGFSTAEKALGSAYKRILDEVSLSAPIEGWEAYWLSFLSAHEKHLEGLAGMNIYHFLPRNIRADTCRETGHPAFTSPTVDSEAWDSETLASLLSLGLEPQEREQDILRGVADRLREQSKVESIYFERYRESLQFQVLLGIDQYDSDLMDVLLNIEYDIRERWPQKVFQFSYVPVGLTQKDVCVHPEALCVYVKR